MNTFNLFYAAYFRYLAAVWLLSTADLLPTGDYQLLPHASRLTPYAYYLSPAHLFWNPPGPDGF